MSLTNDNLPPLEAWQFRIRVADGTAGHQLGRVNVETGSGLDEVLLEDAAGAPVGLLLGFVIDLEENRQLTSGVHRLSFALEGDVDAFAERVLESFGGRFLWVCTAKDTARVYLDCAGQVPCVFDPEHAIAGSSAAVLMSETAYETRFDQALFDKLGLAERGWFPAGLTAHHGLFRQIGRAHV